MPCRVVPCRASRRVAPNLRAAPRHATPCRCRADLLSSRVRVPAHPHGSVRSSGSVLIGGWQSGQADRFSLAASLSVSLSLSRPPPAPAAPPSRFPSPPRPPRLGFLSFYLLSRSPSSFQSIFFSSETHFPRLPAAACLRPFFSLSLSLSLFHPLRRRCPRPRDPDGDALVLVATTLVAVHVDYHPSCRLSPFTVPRAPRREKIFMPMYRFAVPIAPAESPRAISIPAASVTVNRICHRYECFMPTILRQNLRAISQIGIREKGRD